MQEASTPFISSFWVGTFNSWHFVYFWDTDSWKMLLLASSLFVKKHTFSYSFSLFWDWWTNFKENEERYKKEWACWFMDISAYACTYQLHWWLALSYWCLSDLWLALCLDDVYFASFVCFPGKTSINSGMFCLGWKGTFDITSPS